MGPGGISHLNISLLMCNNFYIGRFSSEYTYSRKVRPLFGSLLRRIPGTLQAIARISQKNLPIEKVIEMNKFVNYYKNVLYRRNGLEN